MGSVSVVSPDPPGSPGMPQSTPGERPKACPSCGARYPLDALFCSLDGSPLTTSPSVIAAAAATDPYLGKEILGHIEIRQLVGIGAMGRVYRAFQRGIDRDLAVKILHRELSSNEALVARFDREAKVASRLAHPNVVHVLLVGQLPDGAMYIVMEYLDGLSLQSALAAVDGAMPLPRALHVALQLCDAAGEGHAQGIVHRDLKPENVMLVRRADDPDFVKVLDFGIARVHWGEQSMATAAGLIFGTARYISPEGAQGEQVGPPGDVYSIATMLYQMLAGRAPFEADQAVALLVQQIHDPPKPLRSIARAAYVPEPIATVIMKNLAKAPRDRSPDARAFGRALLEAAVSSGLSAQEVLARPSLLGGPRGSHPSAVQMPSMQRTRQLDLDPTTAARIGAVTAFETPAPSFVDGSSGEGAGRAPTRTEIADPSALPPGTATTKWVAPAHLQAKLAPPPSVLPLAVDETMDDRPRPSARTAALPTALVTPPVPRASEVDTAPPGGVSVRPRAPSGPHFAGGPQSGASVAPQSGGSVGPQPRSARTPSFPSKPPSSVDTTMAGEEAPGAVARGGPPAWRGALLGVLCFLVGASGMTGVAWKAGFLGNLGRRAAPSEPGERLSVGRPQADIQPVPAEPPASLPPLELSVPPLSKSASSVASAGTHSASSAAPPNSTRAVVESSSGKPGIGQPVDFVARVVAATRPTKVEAARFVIAGPGIAPGTELPASDDGSGAFRTTFTFLQGGHFQVDFSASADGAPVRGGRAVVVGEGVPPAPVPAQSPAAPPTNANATGASTARWL
jgi:eukaryotic-like serine/threonine-protein kinase